MQSALSRRDDRRPGIALAILAALFCLLPLRTSASEIEHIYKSCNATERATIQAALEKAQTLAVTAFDDLALTSLDLRPVAERYLHWFGAYDSDRYNTVTVMMHNIKYFLTHGQYEFYCNTATYYPPAEAFAPNWIELHGGFFASSAYGQGLSMLHETSHFFQTRDHAYGLGLCADLARDRPDKAIYNADSYEFFAANELWMPMGFDRNETMDQFGWSLVAGYLNDDKLPDLVVGAPGNADSEGKVFIYKGTSNGTGVSFPDEAQTLTQHTLGPDGGAPGDEYGHALAIGDFNGDQVPDLAVGSPGKEAESGAVFVYNGDRGLVAPYFGCKGRGLMPAQYLRQQPTGLGLDESGDRFGASLAVGDFDGNEMDDLAVGVPGENHGQGRVYIFYGSANGLMPDRVLGQASLGTDENGDEFGMALAWGDFDGDGRDDLAVGAPGENDHRGMVFVYRGSNYGLYAWRRVEQAWIDDEEQHDLFGEALVAADFDDDGLDDLAVGTPGEDGFQGRVYTFKYTPRVRFFQAWELIDQSDLDTNEAHDLFGSSLQVARLQTDDIADLLVGARGEDNYAGKVYAYRGTRSGMIPLQAIDQKGMGLNEADDLFGFSLAAGFDLESISQVPRILVISAPLERYGHPRCGYAFVYDANTLAPITGIDQEH